MENTNNQTTLPIIYQRKRKIINLILFSFLLLFLAIPVGATLTSPVSSGYDLELKLDPEYPSANQTVSVKVELYGLAIEKYEILWSIDGVLKKRGIGQKEFFFQTGNWGENIILTVQINTPNNGQLQKQLQITPTEVDLIWEANTYTPPFYKGKALNSSKAIVNVTVLPNFIDKNGQKIPNEKLIYNWQEDWKVKGNQSGYGKSTFSLEGPQTNRSKSIKVTVTSLDGALKAEKSISFRAISPEIVFYKQDPLLGVLYNTAIKGEYNFGENEEIKIMASPFFFSPQNEINYNWTMNGQTMNISNNEIILRQPDGQTGSAQIALKIQNMDSILQFTDSNFIINFGNNTD